MDYRFVEEDDEKQKYGLWSESGGMVGCARRSIGCDTIFGGGGTVRFSLGIAIFYGGHLYLPCSNSRVGIFHFMRSWDEKPTIAQTAFEDTL